MRNQFTAIFEFDNSGDKPRYVARCPEIIGVSAEGKTVDEARERLIEEIKAELKVRREKKYGRHPDRCFARRCQRNSSRTVIA